MEEVVREGFREEAVARERKVGMPTHVHKGLHACTRWGGRGCSTELGCLCLGTRGDGIRVPEPQWAGNGGGQEGERRE